MHEPRRVVVIKPCCIGDAVMAIPALQNLRAALPDAHIEVWSGNHSKPIFAQHPAIDAVSSVPDIPKLIDLPSLIVRLRASHADALIVLDRSRLLERAARLSGIPALATVARDAGAKHESDCYLDVLRDLDISVEAQPPLLSLTPEQRELALARTLSLGGRFVVLHPGGAENPGARMHSKRWPVERWIEVANWLCERGIGIAMTGSPAERGLCLEIAARSQAGLDSALVLAGELDLLESTGVAELALAFVGPDTGMSHLAAATGAPTIAIFGPTNPARYAPRGRHVTVLAPDASWALPDADLRRASAGELPTTREICAASVVSALEQAIALTPGSVP